LADQGLHVVVTARLECSTQAAVREPADEACSLSAHQLDATDAASGARHGRNHLHHGRLGVPVNNVARAIGWAHSAAATEIERGVPLAEMNEGSAAYRVSKAGLNALTRILAAELHTPTFLVNPTFWSTPSRRATCTPDLHTHRGTYP
jgi:NAD(P)-dependent dehydrogenase (short-subunit alcohol dehydrogenase family)